MDGNEVLIKQREMQLPHWHHGRKFQVDVLAGLFGISAWVCVNAMFTQLPLLVQTAPEGWNLPSYLSIIVQIANVGPILYSLSQMYCPNLIRDSKLIYFILILGSCSLVLLSFLYSHTWTIFDDIHSGPLFILAFCISLVGCTSSVLFIPFMNNYPEVYLISYMIGEGLSGFLPSVLSLSQGIGGNPTCVNATSETGESILVPSSPDPRFSTKVFFLIIFCIMTLSTISFFLLNNLPTCKKQKIQKRGVQECSSIEDTHDSTIKHSTKTDSDDSNHNNSLKRNSKGSNRRHSTKRESDSFASSSVTPLMYSLLLGLQTIISFFSNGALNSIQSYSCLPYGNLAYHFAVNLGSIANPTACFICFFVPHTALNWIFTLSGVILVCITYLFTTALMSPTPPLQHSTLGVVLIVSILAFI